MPADWNRMTWHVPPPRSSVEGGVLTVETALGSDYWRETQYGFSRDAGHALLMPAPPEFTATVSVQGEYAHLYDQAGLMLRSDERHWLKQGVEFVGRQQWSAVVTRGKSDWSVLPAENHALMHFRCIRRGNALILHVRPDDEDRWTLMRVADYPPELGAQVGVFACSPERAGFRAHFHDFQLLPADLRPLHELTEGTPA